MGSYTKILVQQIGYYINRRWYYGHDNAKLGIRGNRYSCGRQGSRHVTQQNGRPRMDGCQKGVDGRQSNEEKMMPFYQEIKHVLKREGGYVNDPDDPGGETKYGISKRAHPDVDIAALTPEDAAEIYKDNYWIPSKVERLPDKLQSIYFDMVVNQGQSRAVKILQQAANGKRKKDKIAVDGKIGPNTIKACDRLGPERLKAYRIMHYAKLVTNKPSLEKYYYGWFRRAMEV